MDAMKLCGDSARLSAWFDAPVGADRGNMPSCGPNHVFGDCQLCPVGANIVNIPLRGQKHLFDTDNLLFDSSDGRTASN
jgi:hypothetical protein